MADLLARDLASAKEAYNLKDPARSRLAHSTDKLPCVCEKGHATNALSPDLRKWCKAIFSSGMTGLMTTSATVSAIVALEINVATPLALYCVVLALLAGISVATGCAHYTEKTAEREFFNNEREREEWECDNYLEGEQEEMVELYVSKGMEKSDAETVISLLSKNKKMFVDIMMVEELCLSPPANDLSPFGGAIARIFSIFIFGVIPLITLSSHTSVVLFGVTHQSFLALCAATAVAIGIMRVHFCVDMGSWWKHSVSHLLVLAATIGAVHAVGLCLRHHHALGAA